MEIVKGEKNFKKKEEVSASPQVKLPQKSEDINGRSQAFSATNGPISNVIFAERGECFLEFRTGKRQ